MSKLKTIFSALVIAVLLTNVVHREQIHAPVVLADEVIANTVPEIPLSPTEYADKYAEQYGIDASVFKKVMFCESQNKPNPPGYNDGGAAFGIFQFHKPTFVKYSKEVEEDLEYTSYKDQIHVAAYMFSIGQQHQWTCYHKVTGK